MVSNLYYDYRPLIIFNFINHAVSRASSNVAINTTSREICLASTTVIDCSLARFTLYNISIFDFSNNLIFKMDNIPESSCLTVDQLDLLPECGPFMVSTRPFNDYIMYDAQLQQIITSG